MPRNIALQLYTIRQELEENPERALERVKAIGLDSVEIAPLPNAASVRRIAGVLRSLNLAVAAIHSDLPLGEKAAQTAELAEQFNCRRVVWHGWPRDPAFDTPAGLSRLLQQYNEAQTAAEARGLELGLHNHWWEFELAGGRIPHEQFFDQLNPKIFLEIDTYWVRTAGLDPAAVLTELRDRVTFLHVKDGPARQGAPMAAVGSGVMDFPSILQAAGPKVEWLVIELDECATDIWRAIGESLQYLRGLPELSLRQ